MLAQAAPNVGNAAELVRQMQAAQHSAGFSLRLQITDSGDRPASAPVKLALIGQADADGRRLQAKGIAPAAVRDQTLLADLGGPPPGCVRALAAHGSVDPHAPLLGTPLTLWDLLGAWWYWPRQTVIGHDRVGGQECTLIRSRPAQPTTPIREVVSCIDAEAGLSWRTQWFAADGSLLRTITVLTALRHNNGRLSPRRALLTAGQRSVDIEAYSGDEYYTVAATTFSPLAGVTSCAP
jgi:hypothetical protein